MPDEYISRAKALELLKSLGSRDYRREKGTIQDAIKMISSSAYTPAADVAPVVRCRGCEYVRPIVSASSGGRVGIWCALHDILNVSPDDYCSRGLRKGGNGNVSG